MLEAGGADRYTSQAIPGSEPGQDVTIQACPAVLCPIALCDWGRAGLCSCGNRRHPGVSGEGVADGVHDVGAVLAGSVEVAADGVAVAGGGLGAEPARDLLLGFRRAQVALGLIWISR